jgi:isopentenyl phosphate kinase
VETFQLACRCCGLAFQGEHSRTVRPTCAPLIAQVVLGTATAVMATGVPAGCMASAVIVKLGGAALTDKASYRSLKREALDALAAAVGAAHARGVRLVVVHGAGSFGHHEAAAHSLNSHKLTDLGNKTPLGIAACRSSLAALHSLVLDALLAAHVPAVSVSVFPVGQGYEETVAAALTAGLVPVLHGDVLLAPPGPCSLRCTVLSGDGIVEHLSRSLPAPWVAQRVVFVTGAPGVFTAPPDRPQLRPRLIRAVLVCGGAEAALEHAQGGGGEGDVPADGHGWAAAARPLAGPVDAMGAPAATSQRTPHVRFVLDEDGGAPGGTRGEVATATGAAANREGATDSLRVQSQSAHARGAASAGDVPDVTGGIAAKLDAACRIVDRAAARLPALQPGGELADVVVSIVGTCSAGLLSACLAGATPAPALVAAGGTHVMPVWTVP